MTENKEKVRIEPGKKLKIFWNPDNINNKLIHIRAIVDYDQVVFRWWSKHKQRWIYEIEDLLYFDMIQHNNAIFEA